MRRVRGVLLGMLLVTVGCGRLLGDRTPPSSAPAEVKRITFEIVARGNRCEPLVLAADRQGRALLITFQVTSVGKEHRFLIPDLDVRKTIPADAQVSIPLIADRSGIFEYACTASPWITPLTAAGKLAIK